MVFLDIQTQNHLFLQPEKAFSKYISMPATCCGGFAYFATIQKKTFYRMKQNNLDENFSVVTFILSSRGLQLKD